MWFLSALASARGWACESVYQEWSWESVHWGGVLELDHSPLVGNEDIIADGKGLAAAPSMKVQSTR